MKHQINIRASDMTMRQLGALTAQCGTSITETVSLAIDRMYRGEIKMDRILHNLTSGASYLTESSEHPEVDGQIIYDNIMAVATRLYGDEPTDADIEYLIDRIGAGTFDAYTADLDIETAAIAIDKAAKTRGGTGWL